MAFTLAQVGTSLKLIAATGEAATLTLPTGISLSASLTPRFAVYGNYVVMVNSPSRPITIDGNGICRVLTPSAPASKPALSGVAGGALTGTFRAKQTFRIRDASNNIIAESAYGPQSDAVAITGQYLKAAGLSTSQDDITESEIYRTTTLGSVFFPWTGLSGNTQTAVQDDLSDAGLSLVAAPTLGAAPDLTRVCAWKSRLWGVDRSLGDILRWTESGKMYAWGSDNNAELPEKGTNGRGLIGFMPRRDQLVIGKANVICQITGTTSADIRLTTVTNMLGIESQESAIVYRDTAFFLWQDGVYKMDSDGIECISDKGGVRSWFTTNNYFNRRQFAVAFAHIDTNENKYRLFLCSAGSNTVDRWVEYDMTDKTWWGPHKTAAFTPQCAFLRVTSNGLFVPTVGDNTGYVWQKQATRTDDTATAIDLSVDSKKHDQGDTNADKFWGKLTIVQVPQAAGSITVTPTLGSFETGTPTTAMVAPMTTALQQLERVGVGETMQLNFRQNVAAQDVKLLGYEIEDVHRLGVRL